MARKYSLAYLTVGNLEPSAQVYVAKTAGYDYVGLRPLAMGLPSEPNLDLVGDEKLRDNLRRALDETGVGVWDIELARVADGVDYDGYAPAIQLGADLGARVLLTSVWTDDHAAQVEGLRRVARLGADHGLQVVSEFVPLSSVKTLQAMADLIREADEPNLGMLIDAYHYDRGGATLAEVEALPTEWLPMIHVCDCPARKPAGPEELREEVRERRLYVGEGASPVADVLGRMHDDAVVAIEQPHLARVRELGETEFATRCLDHARTYLETYGLA